MKEELDFYQSYNAEQYIHYRLVPTGQYEVVDTKRNGKVYPTRRPILEKRIVDFEEIKQMDLDSYGMDVRTHAGNFTSIHHYFLDYWGAIMGSDAVVLFTHLKRYCYGELKDFCFPDIETIRLKMNKGSRNTILKNIDILEQYGFIVKVLRKDTKRNNGDASPFFKVRKYIPLLSEDLIKQLPEPLQLDHERFLVKTNGIVLSETFEPKMAISDIKQMTKDVMKSSAQVNKEKELKRTGKLREYVLTKLTEQQHEDWFMILEELKSTISKPSFETWFLKSLFVVDRQKQCIKVLSESEFCVDFLRKRYVDYIKEIVVEKFEFNSCQIDVELYDSYINGIEAIESR